MKRKEYLCPSILVIEAEIQHPIAGSNLNGLQVDPWDPESGDGTIQDN